MGRDLINADDGFVATVSSRSINKMLSGKALGKSNDNEAHSFVVANIDHIYENSIRVESVSPKESDKGSKIVHRYKAPILHNNEVKLVKMTVKELIQQNQGNRVYSVEIEGIANPTSKEQSLTNQVSSALAGSHEKLSKKIEEIKTNQSIDGEASFSIGNSAMIDSLQAHSFSNAKTPES